MKKSSEILLTTGIGLCIAGGILLTAGYLTGGISYVRSTDFHSIKSQNIKNMNSYTLKKTKLEGVHKIDADFSEIDLEIRRSDDTNCYLSYQTNSKQKSNPFSYTITDGTLEMKESGSSNPIYKVCVNLDFFSTFFGEETEKDPWNHATLYLPADQTLDTATFHLDDGDLIIEDLQAKTAEISLSFGDFICDKLNANQADITLEDGDAKIKSGSLENAVISNKFGDLTCKNLTVRQAQIHLGDGDFITENASFETADFTLDYGDLISKNSTLKNGTATLTDGDLTGKNLTITGQTACQLAFGDASVTLSPETLQQISLKLLTKDGDLLVPVKTLGGTKNSENDGDLVSYERQGTLPEALFSVTCEDGDITVK